MKLQLRKAGWSEKRDSVRLELECPVTFRTLKSGLAVLKKKSEPEQGLMLKPSMKGLRLLTSTAIPHATRVEIRVDMTRLGYDRIYEVHGIIVWTEYSAKTKGYEQGVSLNTKGPDTKKWERYIMECLQRTDRTWGSK